MKARYPAIKAKYSGSPRIVETVLNKKYKESDFVFVCDCNDLFAADVPDEVIVEILRYYQDSPAKLFFQTKNPLRMLSFNIPKDAILCCTIETNRSYTQMGTAPSTLSRASSLRRLHEFGFETQVTIEPIMDFDLWQLKDIIQLARPSQVNIGADSSRNNLPEPDKSKILALIEVIQEFTTVKQKSNLKRLLK